jgi:small subunit ribosomal protein S5
MADKKKTEKAEAKVEEAKVEETAAEAAPAEEAKADEAPAAEEAPAEEAAAAVETAPVEEAPAPETETAEAAPADQPAAEEAAAVEAEPSVAAETQSTASGDATEPRGPRDARGGRGGRGGGDRGGRDGGRGRGRGGRDDRRGRGDDDGGEELIEKLVHINRVSKTVKGGKRFGFAALVVVGDGKGRVGFGHGKAREVPEAINKATAAAKKKMIRVALKEGRTLHHDGKGRFGAGKVNLRTAPAGTGIIAGGPMRAVFESLGVADVVTKSIGTSNPYNMIRATFAALTEQTSPKSVAQRRGKKVADLLGRGGASEAEAEADAAAMAE